MQSKSNWTWNFCQNKERHDRDLKSEWTCESCGAVHDRKYNGAQNVLMAGHDILNEIEESFVSKAKKPKKKAKNKG